MTDYFVDKRESINGDGSASSPWNSIDECLSKNYISDGDTVYLIKGSGPYYPSDISGVIPGVFYPNFDSGSEITYDFGGNVITSELDMSSGYDWVETSYEGETLYYATAVGGGDPNISTVLSGIIDGVWDVESTSLFGEFPSVTDTTHVKKWGYGDKDSLGFNTVYVRGINPIDGSHSILVSITNTKLLLTQTSGVTYNFQNGILRGGGEYTIYNQGVGDTLTYNRMEFQNTDDYAIRYRESITATYCKFINSGHEAVDAPNDSFNLNLYHCHFENVHTITKLTDTVIEETIVTLRNCSTKNILAGILQHDSTTMTLVEDHNQFDLDLENVHGGDALAFTTGTRQWTVTDSTDLPPDTSTTLTTSVDSLSTYGKFLNTSPCVDQGAWISGINDQGEPDIWGKYVNRLPNIGPDQGAGSLLFKKRMLNMNNSFNLDSIID